MTSCVLMLVYASLYYMYNQDMVYWLSRLLSRFHQNYTIKGLGIIPRLGGGGMDNSEVSVNASYINNDGFVLFMCGDHFQDNLNLCTEGMGVTHGLLSYMLSSSLYHGYIECA